MKRLARKILSYLITCLAVIGFWKLRTWTGNYAWNPKGKELLLLDIALTSIFFHKTLFWLLTANTTVYALLQLNRKKFKKAGVIIVLTVTYHFAVGQVIDKKCAFHYYVVFQNQSVAEGDIVCPIEEAGYRIGPILTGKIREKEMKYRRYAILGLQKIGYEPATGQLGKILFDTSELEVYRMDAYKALKAFDNKPADLLLRKFKSHASDTDDLKQN